MLSRLPALVLMAMALDVTINTDKYIERRGDANNVRPPPVATPARLEGYTHVCEFRKPAGDCTDLLFSYCSGSFTYRPVPSYEGCVAGTTRRSSNAVHRSSGREVRVRTTPRVIDLSGLVELQPEESACLGGRKKSLDCDDE